MNILVIDQTVESQKSCAEAILSIDPYQRERLTISMNLSDDQHYSPRLASSDVVVLGPELADGAQSIARAIAARFPKLPILRFVDWEQYGGDIFQRSHAAGIRKVLHLGAPELDILQELLAIQAERARDGRAKQGRLVVVIGSGGGAGVTSLSAALGELSSSAGKCTLLWDTNAYSADLSRGLLAFGPQGSQISAWLSGEVEFSHEAFESALVSIGEGARLLMPPSSLFDAERLSHDREGIEVVQRVLNCARTKFDITIVDLSNLQGEAWRAVLAQADRIALVAGGSVLGSTAIPRIMSQFAEYALDSSRIVVVCNRAGTFEARIKDLIKASEFTSAPKIISLPFDAASSNWPGTNKTLWSLGKPSMRRALIALGLELGMCDAGSFATDGLASKIKKFLVTKKVLGEQVGQHGPIVLTPDREVAEA